MEGTSICPICNESFHWIRKYYNKAPKTCSNECRYKSASISQKGKARVNTIPGERKWKRKAQRVVQRLVKQGVIKRLSCFCGEIKVEGHHYLSYEKTHWLYIKWLCSKHHHQEHDKLRRTGESRML